MNDQDRTRYASIFMMAFPVVVLLLMLRATPPGRSNAFLSLQSRNPAQLILLAAIFLIGLVRMPPSPWDRKPLSLSAIANVYAGAWRQLWRHRWILWIFGGVVVISLVGFLAANYPFTARFATERNRLVAAQVGSAEEAGRRVVERALSAPISAVLSFFPTVERPSSAGGFLAHSVVFMIGAIWLLRKLKRMRLEPAQASGAQWLQIGLIPIAVCFLGLGLVLERALIGSYLATVPVSPRTYTIPGMPGMRNGPPNIGVFGGPRAWTNLEVALPWAEGIYYLILSGLLIAGLAGSLKRLKLGQSVTVESFVKDVALHSKPVVAAYLVTGGVGLIFSLPMYAPMVFGRTISTAMMSLSAFWLVVPLLFMLVPYAAVARNVGAWQGIKSGLRDILANAWGSATFVALGITLLSIPLILHGLLRHSLRYWYGIPQSIGVAVISAVVYAVIGAFMAVAVWDYYWLIVNGREKRVVREE
ncbi:MAG: hypothetical protein Q7T82_12525 [Armatimonadota bacterium]|nr:hypothetical protein [Armatimonadota bacterium]